MAKNIVPIQKTDSDIVDGVIINQISLKALYYILKALDFVLVIVFFAMTRWLLKEGFNPMFGLGVLLVRYFWHGIDIKVSKELGIETQTKSKKRG